jgi:hypothetical protein
MDYKTFTVEERNEIANSNNLAKEYYDLVSDTFKNYYDFVVAVKKDYKKVYDLLPNSHKSKFFDDLMILRTPIKYENKMQEVCKGLVLKAVKIRSFERMDYDEAYVEGMLATDKALWMYRDSSIKIQSYAMTCALSRLADYREKQFNKSKKAKEYGFDDFDKAPITKEDKSLNRAFKKNTTVVLEDAMEKEEDKVNFDDLFNMACVDDLDKTVFKTYIENNRKGSETSWVDDVIKFVELNDNKRISATAVRKRLTKIQERVKNIVDEKGLERKNILL